MRFVTWNCRVGGFRGKAERLAPLLPDVLVAQEVEPIDGQLLFAGQNQPTFHDRIIDPAFPAKGSRGIGVFSYTDTKLVPVDLDDPTYSFRRYEAYHEGLTFQVVGVWTWSTKSRETTYKQALDGLRRHEDWVRQRPTVILGDFNDNASYRNTNWPQLLELVQPLGLASAYHQYFSEPFGQETRPTHFHKGNEAAPFHLDYCFLPDAWVQHIEKVDVGAYADWHHVSDHMPLVVDIDL